VTTDAQVIDIVRGSAVYRAAHALMLGLERGWQSSAIRGAGVEGPRFWAAVSVIASITSLAAAPLGTTPRPLAWLVPASAGILGAALLVLMPRVRTERSRE
jgi:hypothetical protein